MENADAKLWKNNLQLCGKRSCKKQPGGNFFAENMLEQGFSPADFSGWTNNFQFFPLLMETFC